MTRDQIKEHYADVVMSVFMAESVVKPDLQERIKATDFIGRTIGEQTILRVWRDTEKKETMCECRCSCGNVHTTSFNSIRRGLANTCGCKGGGYKHGCKNTRLYRIWQAIKNRCNNPNTWSYKYYGGRGVKVCSEWCDFPTFMLWAENNGYSDELTIDRIDVNGDYSPENCRWVTMKEQNNSHKRGVYQIEYLGQKYSLSAICSMLNLSYPKYATKLYRGGITIKEFEEYIKQIKK